MDAKLILWHVGRFFHATPANRDIDGATASTQVARKVTLSGAMGKTFEQFKTKRKIINRSYQNQEDNIVGKMTIKAIDDELVKADQGGPPVVFGAACLDRIA